jgi:hypothetical protein
MQAVAFSPGPKLPPVTDQKELERGSEAETPPERYTTASSTIKATEFAVLEILEAQNLFTVDMAEGTHVRLTSKTWSGNEWLTEEHSE